MTFPSTATQISAGSSAHVWVLDAQNNLVYQRNSLTRDFETIDPGLLQIEFIDVSYDGHTVALNDQGELYVWDPDSQSFTKHQGVTQTFDQISVGDDAIWALKKTQSAGYEAYQWNSDTGVFDLITDGVQALTVSKADDTVYMVDTSGVLYTYDVANLVFSPLSTEIGIDSVAQMSASSADNLWATDADGALYQLNFVDFLSVEEDPESFFVEKSAELGLDTTGIAQFAIDDQDLLYTVAQDKVAFHETSDVRVQNALADQYYSVAVKRDDAGIVHMVYGTDEAVYHTFNVNGEWLRAVPIPGSSQGTELDLDFDAEGNVYVSWVQGVGNAAEVYVSQGAANTGYAGYVFGPAQAVTDDNVEDKHLDMEVTDDGKVTLTTTKIDADFRHDDHDVYRYGLDRDRDFVLPGSRADVIDDVGRVLQADDFDHFLATAEGLEGYNTLIQFNLPVPGYGFSSKSKNEFWSYRLFGRLRTEVDATDGEVNVKVGAEQSIGFNAKKLFGKAPPASLGGMTVSSVTQPDLKIPLRGDPVEFTANTGLSFGVYVDLLQSKTPPIDGDVVKFSAEVQAGFFADIGWAYQILSIGGASSSDGGAGSPGAVPPSPFTIFDASTGELADGSTAPENVVAQATLQDFITWNGNIAFLPLGFSVGGAEGSEGSPAGGAEPGDPQADNFLSKSKISGYIGIYYNAKYTTELVVKTIEGQTKARLGGVFEFKFRDGGPGLELSQLGARTVVDLTFMRQFWRLVDIYVSFKDGDEDVYYYAAAPGSAEYMSGGTGAVYDADALAFEGNPDGTVSDSLDADSFNYVLGPETGKEIRAYGVYVRELLDPEKNSLNAIYTIEGIFNKETGVIDWLAETAAELGDSVGLNVEPHIALHDDDQLLIAWANAPETDDAVKALNQTPPGKAYVLLGDGISEGGTLDLADLGDDPAETRQGFNYSNAQFEKYLYSIGASVAQLGDINLDSTTATPDFVFGAPDAISQAGVAYVIFGEFYAEIDNIDALDGTTGFRIEGLTDTEFGTAVSTAGDYNGDGISDIAITAPGALDHKGAVYVIYGGNDAAWVAGGGSFSVTDIGTSALPGTVVAGLDDNGRFGTSVAGGYDVTGDTDADGNPVDDLLIGSIYSGTVTVISRKPNSRIEIDISPDTQSDFTGPDVGNSDIGNSIAMLEDVNEDGIGDLLISSSTGDAYLLLGGERLASYSGDYSVSWTPEKKGPQSKGAYQVLVTFNGDDANRDGIISAKSKEITSWLMEVYRNDDLVASYNLKQQLNQSVFDFNYDIVADEVLINSTSATNLVKERYGFHIGDPIGGNKPFFADATLINGQASVTLWQWQTNVTPTLIAFTPELSGTVFDLLSKPESYDLDSLTSYPDSGFELSAATALPLFVANAGDVNGDGVEDMILGYDQSTDENGEPSSGRSYVVYGDSDLTDRSMTFNLDDLGSDPDAGFIIEGFAGGRVSAAGYVNDDKYADLLVSAPFADGPGGEENAGASYIIFGAASGYDPKDAFSISNSNANELSGSSLTSLGDLDGDGRSEVMIGAPQALVLGDVDAALDAAELRYTTRTISGGDWQPSELIGTGLPTGVAPIALEKTARGTLALWVDAVTDKDGNTVYALMASFFDGKSWSADGNGGSEIARQISVATSETISGATIAEITSTETGEVLPFVVWITSDLAEFQSTTAYEATFVNDGSGTWAWSNPERVEPVPGEVPVVPSENPASVLDDGSSSLSVADVHAHESDGEARFIVSREGDISTESGVFHYRLFDYSAVHGVDFEADISGSFTFAPGQDSHAIDVTLLDDGRFEGRAPVQARLEIWSDDPGVTAEHRGLTTDAERLTASLFIEDSSSVLNLASIDSGWQMNGTTGVSLGYAFQSAGFVNNDDFSDLMVAAPNAGEANEGKVYVVYGSPSVAVAAQDLNLDDLPTNDVGGVILTGSVADGYAGTSIAGVPEAKAGLGQTPIAVGAPGTPDAEGGGRVYLISPELLGGNLELSPETVLEIIPGADLGDDLTGNRFGSQVYLHNLGAGKAVDLVVASKDYIYVIYDVFTQAGATSGTFEITSETNFTKIKNGDGTGFGTGLTFFDFDGDTHQDLGVGADQSNPLIDVFGEAQGFGGALAVIRGGANGFGSEVDIANLGGKGFRLLGQADFTPTSLNPPASPEDGDVVGAPRTGMSLVDGIGNAVAAVNLNGDDFDDLIIGAPEASFTDPSGIYTQGHTNLGRVYVLFGGDRAATDWSSLRGDYNLTDLYGNSSADGVIFEGTETSGRAGASVANLGAFRGEKNNHEEGRNFEDLAIGAPSTYGGGGQAYAVLGSGINFGADTGTNVYKIDPTANGDEEGVLPLFTIDSQPQALGVENTSNQGSIGGSVGGLGDVNATSFGSTGGDEFAIGAPRSDIDGVAKSYVATGHYYIRPGTAIDAQDLRSDNGFIIPGDEPIAFDLSSGNRLGDLDDFDGDGYDDVWLLNNSQTNFPDIELRVVLGASIFDVDAATDRVLKIAGEGVLSAYSVAAGDFDGDGLSEIIAQDSLSNQSDTVYFDASAVDANGNLEPMTIDTLRTGLSGDYVNYLAGDFNGDGFDDIVVQYYSGNNATNTTSQFYLNTGASTLSFVEIDDVEKNFTTHPVSAIADLDGDGRDEIIAGWSEAADDEASGYNFNIGSFSGGSIETVSQFRWSDIAEIPYRADADEIYKAVFLPSASGDVNNDGFEDLVLSAAYDARPTETVKASLIVYGAADFSDLSGTTITMAGESPISDDPFGTSAAKEDEFRIKVADIVGDVNRDGFADVLVADAASQDTFVIFGASDLGNQINTPFKSQAGDFIGGYAIQSVGDGSSDPEFLATTVSAAGDLNGDGVANFALGDRHTGVDLAYAIYGERTEAEPDTVYYEGTPDDDIIIQEVNQENLNATAVNVVSKGGDDFVQTIGKNDGTPFSVLIYTGEGDDTIGIGGVDTSQINRIDGGSGWDKLFLDPVQLGQANSLDMTLNRSKISNIEVIDLGANNALLFDGPAIAGLTGPGNTLLLQGVKGTPSKAKRVFDKTEKDPWERLGEDVYDGDIYVVFRYLTEERDASNIHVWIEKGAVTWETQFGSEGTPPSEPTLIGTEGDDTLLLRNEEREAIGSAGADHFVIDERYVDVGDIFTIGDFTPTDGDAITFRFFDQQRTIGSEADLQFYVDNGFAAIDGRDGSAISVSFQNLDGNFGSEDETFIGTRADDRFEGGPGDDRFLMRIGDDIATGGAGGDSFIFDARYVGSGSTHTVTDLDFASGDGLELRFFGPHSVRLTSRAELQALDAENYASVIETGDRTTVVLTNSTEEKMEIEIFQATIL